MKALVSICNFNILYIISPYITRQTAPTAADKRNPISFKDFMALISHPSSSAYEASSFDAPLMVHTWLLLDCDPLLSPLWITWNVRALSETTLLCVCVHIWLRFARKFVSWSSFDPLQNLQPSLLGTLLGIGMGIEANMKCNDAKACQFPIVSWGSKNFKMGLNMLELQHRQCPPPQRPEFERSWHHPAHTLRQLSKLWVCLCDFFCLAGIWRTIRSYSPLSAW